jgi:hypothetical protein
MWDIIVLGQIPGTQIQISFESWLLCTIGVFSGASVYIAMHLVRQSQIVTALRVRHVLQTAAYTQWLVTRRHIQA